MRCEKCKTNMATQKHHLFSQTKLNKKLYSKHIHHDDNIMLLCEGCHLCKSVPKWTELEFCSHFGIEPKSKSGKQKKYNEILYLKKKNN